MRTLKVLLILLLVSPILHGQNKLFVSLNPGVYLYNSENSLKTIENGALRWTPGFSIAYERDSLLGMTVLLEYAYTHSIVNNATTFVYSLTPIGSLSFGADLASTSHHLDIAICFKPWRSVWLAVGPTISLGHRTIELTEPRINEIGPRSLEDRLVSLAIGANASASFELPIQEGPKYLFLMSSLKIRFLRAVWFDRRGRDLDNYYQESLFGGLSLGLGYSF